MACIVVVCSDQYSGRLRSIVVRTLAHLFILTYVRLSLRISACLSTTLYLYHLSVYISHIYLSLASCSTLYLLLCLSSLILTSSSVFHETWLSHMHINFAIALFPGLWPARRCGINDEITSELSIRQN